MLDRLALIVKVGDNGTHRDGCLTLVPIIDGTSFTADDLKSTLLRSNEITIPDTNFISTGFYAIGAGKTYSTVAAFVADFTNLTGNLTGQVQTAITESVSALGTENLNGYTLTFDCDLPTHGDGSSGRQISINAQVHWLRNQYTGTGNLVVRNLNVLRTITTTNYYADILSLTDANVITTIDDNFIHHNDKKGFPIYFGASTLPTCYMFNNILGETKLNGIYDQVVYAVSNALSSSSVFENNTLWGLGSGFALGSCAITCRNNAAACDTTCFAGHANAKGYNNASADATAANASWAIGNNNFTNVDFNNEFYSRSTINPIFYKIAPYGFCANGGTAPTLVTNTYGIRSNIRPHK